MPLNSLPGWQYRKKNKTPARRAPGIISTLDIPEHLYYSFPSPRQTLINGKCKYKPDFIEAFWITIYTNKPEERYIIDKRKKTPHSC
jgi:hypothetical protein